MAGSNGKNSVHIYYCRNTAANGIPASLSKPRDGVLLEAVPCSGRVDTRYLLKAFEGGAKAVCVLTCPSGQCKSMEGNLRAVARVQAAQELLEEAGVKPDSLRIFVPAGSGEAEVKAALESITKVADEVIG